MNECKVTIETFIQKVTYEVPADVADALDTLISHGGFNHHVEELHSYEKIVQAYLAARENSSMYDVINFKCPFCDGMAQGITECINKHIRIKCDNCKIHIVS